MVEFCKGWMFTVLFRGRDAPGTAAGTAAVRCGHGGGDALEWVGEIFIESEVGADESECGGAAA